MSTLRAKFYSKTLGGFGVATLEYDAVYDKYANKTTVNIRSVIFNSMNMGASAAAVMTFASASIRFSDFYNEKNYVTATARKAGISSQTAQLTPAPKTVVIEHDWENPKKKISVSLSVQVSLRYVGATHHQANGTISETIEVGTASIFRVGEENGELYVYSNGKWRVGYLHCADEKKWIIGVGHIILRTDNLSVSHDGNGNVVVNGLEHSHDGNGNVVLTNVTAGYDESGSVTLY